MQQYFSPAAFFARMEPSADASDLTARVFDEYAHAFAGLLAHVCADTGKDAGAGSLHDDYCTFRREKDPARPVLERAFGEKWTTTMLGRYLFPDSSIKHTFIDKGH
jgi:hypothetical protein